MNRRESAFRWSVALAIFATTLLCLAATSAMAQNDIYDNGPINGQVLGWKINFGFAVSDSFLLENTWNINGIQFGAWLFPGDVLETAEVSISSSEFGGTTFFDQTVSFTPSGCFSNAGGFNVCTESGNFSQFMLFLSPGNYWLNLQNAVVNTGDPVYWDMNSGPSLASESSVGTIPSESFTILGSPFTKVSTTGTTLEPSSIMLFGSGLFGLAGIVRRKLF